MKVTYDGSVNAAKIYLKYPIGPGEAARTQVVDENINLDFDSSGRLIGIEVLFASHKLPKELLATAEIIG